jgi:hypothetical protein
VIVRTAWAWQATRLASQIYLPAQQLEPVAVTG